MTNEEIIKEIVERLKKVPEVKFDILERGGEFGECVLWRSR